jgi:phospholipase/carboxylesterase
MSAAETEPEYIHRWEPGQSDVTVLLLHGTGGDENDLISLGKTIAPGVNLLSPRGNVLENGQYNRFFRRRAEGDFDNEDVVFRAGQLAGFVKQASNAYGFDVAKIWALGFSNGANIAAAVLVLHPDVFQGALMLSPMKPIVPETAPKLKGKSVFIGAGSNDTIAPPDGVEALAEQLTGYGADVEAKFYPIGHRIGAEEIDDSKAWFAGMVG